MARADPLAAYNAKRDFKRTREPKGARADAGDGHLFIVQKHDATRLHWDFRLEMEGVLKSWAVTRGPSLDPDDKRLAVRTEDHPLSYAGFEGTIPKGEYGGGTVMLWDVGTWEPVGGKDPAKTIEQGHVHVLLHGRRMQGEWLLVRMKPRPGEKRENWLLRKVADAHAGASGDLVETGLTSVESGRSMAEIARGGDPVWHSDTAKAKADKGAANAPGKPPPKAPRPRRSATPRKPPGFQPVQLATLADTVPGGSGWIHEVKLDGYRTLLACGDGAAKAYTRTGLDWSDRFAPIVAAAATLAPHGALIDGEVIALDKDGRPSFSVLQAALQDGGDLHYFAFDLLEEGGEDLRDLGQIERKARLSALLDGVAPPIHYTEHVEKGGEALFDRLCGDGYEGIVSKAADAPYRGRRTRQWLKVKCTRRQEFVILGYLESGKAGRDLRSLLVGVQEDGGLRYAGKVGTGFDAATRDRLLARLKPLARKMAPADVPKAAARGAHWVTPRLVAEVAFAEYTAEKVLRHASFLGLREDKPAEEVTRDRPVPAQRPKKDAAQFGIAISHPERIVFPDSGATKGDLAAYYAAIAPPMLHWLADRPVSLVRCPQGRGKHCFFQKHDSGSFGGRVPTVAIREKKGGEEEYLVVDSGAAMLTCVQMGTIEFHGWGAPASDVEHPDRMVFDLDPDEGLDFAAVRDAALLLRDHLTELGLRSFAMASGGKGVHVIVPLDRKAGWPEVKDFASRFSRALAQAQPAIFTANMRKADRKGRIFLDWLRNERGATAVLPYSVRARERPTVAAPISWDELASLQDARPYSIRDVELLLERAASPALKDWHRAEQSLPDL
ncbi:DNA ligase D [Sphingomonas sp. AP4-R1]|uniref:DNA ligase D n=1 Tax=Sphingomonas sp. AP4-R1 TaxID=2735134 RepID=UPI001493B8D2|nr:DNA ligase D [Sphingomonas sp. AP4-R1]QJU60743.1 DNA ligase D [Sphingomonas sp. AP4-R1]